MDIFHDPTWLTDERIREIKHGGDYTPNEVLALAGEVRERRRRGDVMPDVVIIGDEY